MLHRARHYTAVVCAKFQNDGTMESDVMGERHFEKSEFKMSFARIFYIAQPPGPPFTSMV